jgi:hypothetical protein
LVFNTSRGTDGYHGVHRWRLTDSQISEVKNFFSDNKKLYDDHYKRIQTRVDSQSQGHGVFFLSYPMSSMPEILRSFPPKQVTDILIARFFDIYNQDPQFRKLILDKILPVLIRLEIIHGPTYQKQYDQHWRSPQDSGIVWLGLTYSMMMIALISYERNGDEPPEYRGRTEQMYRDYRRLTAQSLMLVDFSKGVTYMLEMYIFYLLADLGRAKEPEQNILIGSAILVRHAMRLGYHRDSKYFPGLSPFLGEMRRRIWALIKQADLRISAQFGLPPMVGNDVANTELMRNIYDDELYEDIKELPPSRPLYDGAPISFMIYKAQLADIGYEIVEETQKLSPPSYERAMELDRKLRQARENIPPQFKFQPVEESIRDPSDLIMKRYIVEVMYLKFLLLIHRKYCSCTRYPYSARTGLESAMEILKHQQSMTNELRPGRRLADARMFVTSLTAHDFLLAAMIVCMALYRNLEDERAGRSPFDPYDRVNRPAMMASIEGSLRIWDMQKDESMEAFKATGILTAMTSLLRQQGLASKTPVSTSSNTTLSPSPFGSGSSPFTPAGSDDAKLAPEHSAAMTLNMLSSGAIPAGAGSAPAPSLFGTSTFDPTSSAAGPAPTIAPPFDGPASAASPFSLFGASTAFQPLDVPNNLDWVSSRSFYFPSYQFLKSVR